MDPKTKSEDDSGPPNEPLVSKKVRPLSPFDKKPATSVPKPSSTEKHVRFTTPKPAVTRKPNHDAKSGEIQVEQKVEPAPDHTHQSISENKPLDSMPFHALVVDPKMMEAFLNSQKMVTNQQELLTAQLVYRKTKESDLEESRDTLRQYQDNHNWLREMIWDKKPFE
ncbi:uncharacterized protein I303_100986 [Kwoniella dejecticola CBS 10117]|uniref:Uncharacterized protein n=1 Tax=Kwoniella dejecticola CBS 10117 TaxID=1296121 RepID=A0A1A6AGN4_9TREE|nr:uncharacterized protein I303_00991 [Kwoniella dejecticola CBS 10117]OBR89168.1 hypothetical protein I303_00991 [Kwoniella dejecticola CBS 10117]